MQAMLRLPAKQSGLWSSLPPAGASGRMRVRSWLALPPCVHSLIVLALWSGVQGLEQWLLLMLAAQLHA